MTQVSEVAEGVHEITRARTNMFLVETNGRLLIVDAGLPAFWPDVQSSVRDLGFSPEDIDGLLLTHGHFDHVGCARRMQEEWGLTVWVDEADRALAEHPYSYEHERNRVGYLASHPGGLPTISAMAAAGALNVTGIPGATAPPDRDGVGSSACLPPGVVIIPAPGHTDGSIAVHLPERDVLLTGDALVTLDPYTGESGPQIVAGAATADSARALASLDLLADTGARLVVPGHGAVWTDGIRSAVDEARSRGAH